MRRPRDLFPQISFQKCRLATTTTTRIPQTHYSSYQEYHSCYDRSEKSCSFVVQSSLSCRRRGFAASAGGSGSKNNNNYDDNDDDPHAPFREQMEQLKREREEMFGFTEEDHLAWTNIAGNGNDQLPSSLMDSVETARTEQQQAAEEADAAAAAANYHANNCKLGNHNNNTNIDSITDSDADGRHHQPSHHHGLTHLSEDGSSVNMVDVGHKTVTQRIAKAETRVILPPEVVSFFKGQQQNEKDDDDELVGPKGPIFATAKIAGIMAAKKTSDLIPLCHPLPLDKVQIDIRMMSDNVVLISCECRVTHKTGVEMEALTGSTVAALTIYDMIKAISHNIRIEQTVLVGKSGGKRTVG